LEEILSLHPDHLRAKPWLAQFGTREERQRKKLTQGKVGDTLNNDLGMKFALPRGLWCGVYPVTQVEWQAVMGNNPAKFSGHPRYPVEQVSWNDVQEF